MQDDKRNLMKELAIGNLEVAAYVAGYTSIYSYWNMSINESLSQSLFFLSTNFMHGIGRQSLTTQKVVYSLLMNMQLSRRL